MPSTPLSVGSHSITVAEGDGQGFVGPRSGAFSVQITSQPISPTLVVVTHGQQFDPEALKTVALAMLSVIDSALAPIFLGSLSLDVGAGIPLTGSGRNGGEQFQFDIAQEVKDTLSTDLAGAATGECIARRELGYVWLGRCPRPVRGARIQQIVSDTTQFNGTPWDILFVGYSRGAIFNNNVIQDLNIPSDRHIDYTEAVLLDPTASTVSGDVFPSSVPPGVAREIVYDDGYAFPAGKVGGTVLGLPLPSFPLLAVDSNSTRIPGAEYYNEQIPIRTYAESQGQSYTGVNAQDSDTSHLAVPYWYYNYLNNPKDPNSTQLAHDIAAFIVNKDGGTSLPARPAGGKSLVVDLDPVDPTRQAQVEVISPPSSAPDFSNIGARFRREIDALGRQAATSAAQAVKQIIAKAKALAGQVAAQAKQLGNQLVASAKAEGGKILAEAKLQQAKLLREAQAEVNKLVRAGAESGEFPVQAGEALR